MFKQTARSSDAEHLEQVTNSAYLEAKKQLRGVLVGQVFLYQGLGAQGYLFWRQLLDFLSRGCWRSRRRRRSCCWGSCYGCRLPCRRWRPVRMSRIMCRLIMIRRIFSMCTVTYLPATPTH